MKKSAIILFVLTLLLVCRGAHAQKLLYSGDFYQNINSGLPLSCKFSLYDDHVTAGDLTVSLFNMNGTFYDYRGEGIQILWSPYVPGCVSLFINQTATVYMQPQATIPPDFSGYLHVPSISVPGYGGYSIPGYGVPYYNTPPQQCLVCHGTGRREAYVYSPGGRFFFCYECGRRRPSGHYHTNCSGCYGRGWIE